MKCDFKGSNVESCQSYTIAQLIHRHPPFHNLFFKKKRAEVFHFATKNNLHCGTAMAETRISKDNEAMGEGNTYFPKPNMRRRRFIENSGLLALESACRWLKAFPRSAYVRMVFPSASLPEALFRSDSMRGVAILAVSGSK